MDADAKPLAHALHLHHLSFAYAGRLEETLSDIDFRVDRGEVLLLCGPTGCGKSTLLKCMGGIIPHLSAGHLSGEVFLEGLAVSQTTLRQLSGRVGLVLQNSDAQLVATEVEAEVLFGLENLGLLPDEARARATEALTRVHLLPLRHAEVKTLSGGQKQRLVLAALLALEPEVLLLDEPISQLDPRNASEVLTFLKELKASRRQTLVIVEHRLEELVGLVDRVVLLNEGRVIIDLPADEAWAVPSRLSAAKVTPPGLPAFFEQLGRGERPLEVGVAAALLPAVSGLSPLAERPSLSASREILLEVKGLSLAFEGKGAVLRDVNLALRSGERVALLGANGAGKSTLLFCLAGVLKGASSAVRFEGRALRGPDPAIGLLLQEPDLMLVCDTVQDELELGLRLRGLPVHPDTLSSMLKALELEDLAQEAPLALSRGQRLRVALASVLACRPRLLLLDEPTTGQDKRQIERLMTWLDKAPGVETVVFCTHDLEVALRHATRVVVLERGLVVEDGAPAEVLPRLEQTVSLPLPPLMALSVAMTGRALSPEALLEVVRADSP